MDNLKRRTDLAGKFLIMGTALLNEGLENDDKQLINAANLLMMIGGLIINEEEMNSFNNLASMFTSHKLMEMFQEKGIEISKFLLPIKNMNSFDSIIENM